MTCPSCVVAAPSCIELSDADVACVLLINANSCGDKPANPVAISSSVIDTPLREPTPTSPDNSSVLENTCAASRCYILACTNFSAVLKPISVVEISASASICETNI